MCYNFVVWHGFVGLCYDAARVCYDYVSVCCDVYVCAEMLWVFVVCFYCSYEVVGLS